MPHRSEHNLTPTGKCPCGYAHLVRSDGRANIHTAIHPLTGQVYTLVRHNSHGPLYPAGLGPQGINNWFYWDRVKNEQKSSQADKARRSA